MNVFARALRHNATDAERLLWSRLRTRRLSGFRFRQQRPLGPHGCDFVCLQASVIVELDGSQHAARMAYDARRDAFLRSQGFRVLRFWNVDLFRNSEAILDTIFEALHRWPPGCTV